MLLWIFLGCFTIGKVMSTIMVIVWGYPDSTTNATSETLSWENCVTTCHKDYRLVMCAQKAEDDTLCYKYPFGFTGIIEKKEASDNSKVAIKLNTSNNGTCAESYLDYLNSGKSYNIPRRIIDTYQITTTPENNFQIIYNLDKCNWQNPAVSDYSCEYLCLTRMVSENFTPYENRSVIQTYDNIDTVSCIQYCYVNTACAFTCFMSPNLCMLFGYSNGIYVRSAGFNHTMSFKFQTNATTCKDSAGQLYNYTYHMEGFDYSYTMFATTAYMSKRVNTTIP